MSHNGIMATAVLVGLAILAAAMGTALFRAGQPAVGWVWLVGMTVPLVLAGRIVRVEWRDWRRERH